MAGSLHPGPGHSVIYDTDRPTLASFGTAPQALTRQVESTICTGASGQLLVTDRGTLHDVRGRRSTPALESRYLTGHQGAMSGDGLVLAFFRNGHASAFRHDHAFTSVVAWWTFPTIAN